MLWFSRSRRHFAPMWLATVLLVAAGCGDAHRGTAGAGRSASVARVTFLGGLNVQGWDSYVYVAKERGFLAGAGIEVDVKPGQGTEGNLKVLQGGQADFATVDIAAAITDYGTGAFRDFTVVNALQQHTLACLMALEGSGIAGPHDLANKRIGYIPGGVVKVLFDAYARLAGVPANSVKWVNVPPQQLGSALAAGTIDASTQFVVGKPAIEAVAQGRKVVVLPYSDYLPGLYGNGIAVSKKLATEKPDLVRRFNTAVLKGLQYAVDHPDEAGKAYAKYQKLQPEAVATAEVTLLKPYTEISGQPVGALTSDRVAQNIAILESAAAMPSGVVKPGDVASFDLAPSP